MCKTVKERLTPEEYEIFEKGETCTFKVVGDVNSMGIVEWRTPEDVDFFKGRELRVVCRSWFD